MVSYLWYEHCTARIRQSMVCIRMVREGKYMMCTLYLHIMYICSFVESGRRLIDTLFLLVGHFHFKDIRPAIRGLCLPYLMTPIRGIVSILDWCLWWKIWDDWHHLVWQPYVLSRKMWYVSWFGIILLSSIHYLFLLIIPKLPVRP